jgi:hypothetical protein
MFNNFLSVVQVLIISILMKMLIESSQILKSGFVRGFFSLFDGIQKNNESQKDEF